MKKNLTIAGLALLLAGSMVLMSFKSGTNETKAITEFASFTVIESIVPSGLGRSRIIMPLEERDYKEFSKVMSEDDNSRNKSDRDEIRVRNYEETKLLNLYNMGGLRFQNIAANDALVKSKVSAMLAEGWQIVSINTGVEANAGSQDGDGVFLTRFYFTRTK